MTEAEVVARFHGHALDRPLVEMGPHPYVVEDGVPWCWACAAGILDEIHATEEVNG